MAGEEYMEALVSEPPGGQSRFEALEGVTVSKVLRSNNTMDIEQRGVYPGLRLLNHALRTHIHPHLCLNQAELCAMEYTVEGL
jgi:hypothetical protein